MGHLVHLSDVPAHTIADARWQPLNEPLGIRNFGISAVAIEPGGDADIEHDEARSQHQEVYVVVSGRAGFRLGDTEVEAGPGDVVAVPDPAERRDYWALEPGTRIVCIGAGPGAEHDFGGWITRAAG
jgi:quercetin dioxygenase-like cupin family protein